MLNGEKVFLRPLQAGDLEKTLKWRNDMFIKTSTMSHPFPITHQQEEKWYETILSSYDNSKIYFAICDNKNGEMIGYTFLNNIDWINRTCYRGTVIGDNRNTGKGYGKEAILLISKYAFEVLNIRKIYVQLLANHPALKTWLDMGAVIEGTLKSHVWNSGQYLDVLILAWYPVSIAHY